jgi:2-iminobutanoate/2-iminopropanoate deaminase
MKFFKIIIYTVTIMTFIETKGQMINTDKIYKTRDLGFSQAVLSNGIIYTSGIVGWDSTYHLTGRGSFEEQAKQCFANLELLLSNANSSMQKVIHLRLYVTEISEMNKSAIANLIKMYFPDTYKPATTLLCVKALARENLKIEIESISNTNNKQ